MRTLQQVEDRVTVFRLIDLARGWQDSPLTAREIKVLLWKYGFLGGDLTLQEISDELGRSKERVRQIEVRALKKLRRAVAQCNPKYKYLDLPIERPYCHMVLAAGHMRLSCENCSRWFNPGIYHPGGRVLLENLRAVYARSREYGWRGNLCPHHALEAGMLDRAYQHSPQIVDDALTKA